MFCLCVILNICLPYKEQLFAFQQNILEQTKKKYRAIFFSPIFLRIRKTQKVRNGIGKYDFLYCYLRKPDYCFGEDIL